MRGTLWRWAGRTSSGTGTADPERRAKWGARREARRARTAETPREAPATPAAEKPQVKKPSGKRGRGGRRPVGTAKGDLVTDDGWAIDDAGFVNPPLPPPAKPKPPPISEEDAFWTGPPPEATPKPSPPEPSRTPAGGSAAWNAAEKAATSGNNDKKTDRSSKVSSSTDITNPYLSMIDPADPRGMASVLTDCAARARVDAQYLERKAGDLRLNAARLEGSSSARMRAGAPHLRRQAAKAAETAELRYAQASAFDKSAAQVLTDAGVGPKAG